MTIIVIYDITGIATGFVAVVLLAVVTVTENGTPTVTIAVTVHVSNTVTIAVIVYGKNTVTANVFYSYCCCYPLVCKFQFCSCSCCCCYFDCTCDCYCY